MFVFILLTALLTVLLALLIYARWHYGTLEKFGIPLVGSPFFIFGNTLHSHKQCSGLLDIHRAKEYGLPIYGVYEGRSPQIHICDPELIHLIMTKDSQYFNDKRSLDLKNPLLNELPDFQPYDKWRIIRNMLTPSFSSGKTRLMSNSMAATLQNFCDRIHSKIGDSSGAKLEKVDLKHEYFSMLTELMASSCFSVSVQNPNDLDQKFVNIVKKLLNPQVVEHPTLQLLSYSFPILDRLLPSPMDHKDSAAFSSILLEMIAARSKSGECPGDVVDLCTKHLDKLNSHQYVAAGITQQTILTQAFVFFLAGQDQISHVMSVMIYFALKNPRIITKLYAELDAFLTRHKAAIEYNNIPELTYLRACVMETLRLFPFFSRTERVCTQDWVSKEFNLKIKRGTTMIIPIWGANRNPKYFRNPDTFLPERWLGSNADNLHPYALTSFGFGPRSCVAQKFSGDVMVLVTAFVLREFEFHLRTDSKPVFTSGGPLFSPCLPFYFDLTARKWKI